MESCKINALQQIYKDQYFPKNKFRLIKRNISGGQTYQNIKQFIDLKKIKTIADFGAGNGNVLFHFLKYKNLVKIDAFEISYSGLKKIRQVLGKRGSAFMCKKMPAQGQQYDLVICTHVLEHIKNYKTLLKNLVSNGKKVFIEIPLEESCSKKKRKELSNAIGHINFFGPHDLNTLAKKINVKILNEKIIQNSLKYERLLKGEFIGTITFIIKKITLFLFGKISCRFFVYNKVYLFSR